MNDTKRLRDMTETDFCEVQGVTAPTKPSLRERVKGLPAEMFYGHGLSLFIRKDEADEIAADGDATIAALLAELAAIKADRELWDADLLAVNDRLRAEVAAKNNPVQWRPGYAAKIEALIAERDALRDEVARLGPVAYLLTEKPSGEPDLCFPDELKDFKGIPHEAAPLVLASALAQLQARLDESHIAELERFNARWMRLPEDIRAACCDADDALAAGIDMLQARLAAADALLSACREAMTQSKTGNTDWSLMIRAIDAARTASTGEATK